MQASPYEQKGTGGQVAAWMDHRAIRALEVGVRSGFAVAPAFGVPDGSSGVPREVQRSLGETGTRFYHDIRFWYATE